MGQSTRKPLLIPAEFSDAMISHCVKSPDRACCGILAGIPPLATAIYPLRNTATNPNRYESDPRDLLHAVTDLRRKGLSIVAIYHSCPGCAAIPSPTDVRENFYGDTPRVIVSLDKDITLRAWRLTAQSYEELAWHLVGSGEWSAAGYADRHPVLPADKGNDSGEEPSSFLRSILGRALGWLWPSTRTQDTRSQDSSPTGHGPMWDPLLDSPRGRNSHGE
jgi:proteasome lid subunit RPN8/RPN11